MEVTLLSREQVFSRNRLEIFEEYGINAPITDFVVFLGGGRRVSIFSLQKNIGCWVTKTDNEPSIITDSIFRTFSNTFGRDIGIRPVLPYSSISKFTSNMVREKGVIELEYGEYPQKIVSKKIAKVLETAYSSNILDETGKYYTTNYYTTNSILYYYYELPFQAKTYGEYKYEGKKYIRIVGDLNCKNEILSDGRKIKIGNPYWIEVSPIKWLVDVEKDIALSKNILLSGIPFDIKRRYDGNFEETFMYEFLNNVFIKDIQGSKEIEISVIEEKSERELALEKLEKDKQKILSLRKNLGK